jgi:hypothetical protein
MPDAVWWWLSFATEEESLGVAIVRGTDVVDAAQEASRRGCNPGGEVCGYRFIGNDADEERELFGANRLILPAELRRAGYMKHDEAAAVLDGRTDNEGRTFDEYIDDTTQTIDQPGNPRSGDDDG